MRRRRPGTIAVTGAADGLGRLVLERLAARPDVAELVAIDATAGATAGVLWRTGGATADRLAGVDTVVHLAVTFDAGADSPTRRSVNVSGTARLLDDARAAGVRRMVLVTSAGVYGPRPGSPVPLKDDAPLRAEPDDGLLGDHVEMERLAGHAVRAGLRVTVLRPATLVGGPLGRTYDGALLRHLSSPRLLAIRGVEPLWQLCHVDDLAAAVELAAVGEVIKDAGVACDGWLPQSTVEQLAGKRRVELPAGVALGTAERLHRLGITTASPRELDHLVAPLVVGGDRLRKAGWQPRWTNEAALRAYLADQPAETDSRAGTYTAAGATVALLGTAALVRQARRRRGKL